jgi:beta-glucanase (GH16 family)
MFRRYLLISEIFLISLSYSQLPPPNYIPFPSLSDEFSGTTLDQTKWVAKDPGWPGRMPGLFDPSNVIVLDGSLQLWAHAAKRNNSWPVGYDNYTTSAIHSLSKIRLGYFEIRWKSGSSGISSSFWLHDNNGTSWTEIDVFETTGSDNKAKGGAKAGDLPSHVHVFSLPGVSVNELPAKCNCTEGTPGSPPCSKPSYFSLPSGETFSSAFHIAGLLWQEDGIQIYLDGTLVNTIPSSCLVQEIAIDFDRETMPGWMELPDPATLPDQPFIVDYIRVWTPPSL